MHFVDVRTAMDGPLLLRQVNWRLRGRRPTRLHRFSKDLVSLVEKLTPQFMLATGQSPITRQACGHLRDLGVRTAILLTDDPWNRAHIAPWFLKALPSYDFVFSTRQANLSELKALGCLNVCYLPFGYDPDLFYPDLSDLNEDFPQPDIAFAGGADGDRLPFISALIRANFRLAIYGDYWSRYSQTRNAQRGYVDPPMLRRVINNPKVALC